MRASTFGFDVDETIEVEILTGPSSTGLCKVADSTRTYVRHIDRLTPLDDEARELFAAWKKRLTP